jgi:L-serine kinase (ATP) / ParB family transcriptional regulator, heme-responsive regulator
VSLIRTNAPPPDLRIVPIDSLRPHEEHDSQRALPLIERLQQESVVINPPIVAPMENHEYVILDGANRYYALSHLDYPHILVQVVTYDSGYVDLKTWRHIIGGWDINQFIQHLHKLPDIQLADKKSEDAIAHIIFRNQGIVAVRASAENIHERNAALREIVSIYQRNAVLHRTALSEPGDIWRLHPDGTAIMVFPDYESADIMAAAQYNAYLPPGISRHIIHGRALRVNYPLNELTDKNKSLTDKNNDLNSWIQQKMANRHVRYYAEATYQFDE